MCSFNSLQQWILSFTIAKRLKPIIWNVEPKIFIWVFPFEFITNHVGSPLQNLEVESTLLPYPAIRASLRVFFIKIRSRNNQICGYISYSSEGMCSSYWFTILTDCMTSYKRGPQTTVVLRLFRIILNHNYYCRALFFSLILIFHSLYV